MTALIAKNPLWKMQGDEATVAAVEYLRRLGWQCTAPRGNGEEFTPADLALLLELKPSTILVRLHHPQCPATTRRLGSKGRLLSVTMSPELEAWLTKPSEPGKPLKA